jgi:hypothetical protein
MPGKWKQTLNGLPFKTKKPFNQQRSLNYSLPAYRNFDEPRRMSHIIILMCITPCY